MSSLTPPQGSLGRDPRTAADLSAPMPVRRAAVRNPPIDTQVVLSDARAPLVQLMELPGTVTSLVPPLDVGPRFKPQTQTPFGTARTEHLHRSPTLNFACERLGLSRTTKFNCYGWHVLQKPLMTFDDARCHLAAFEMLCTDRQEWISLVLDTARLLRCRPSCDPNTVGIDSLVLMHTLSLVPANMRAELVRDGMALFESLPPSDLPVAVKLIGDHIALGGVANFCDMATSFFLSPHRASFTQREPISFAQLVMVVNQVAVVDKSPVNNLGVIKHILGLSAPQRELARTVSSDLLVMCNMAKLPMELSLAFYQTRELATRWSNVAEQVRSTLAQAPIYVASGNSHSNTTPIAAAVITLFHAFTVRDQDYPPPPYQQSTVEPLPPKPPAYPDDDGHDASSGSNT